MAELRNLAYTVIAASDLDAWRQFGTGIIGAGVAMQDDGAVGLRLDDEPWRILVEQGDADDLTHAGWDLGSEDALDSYVAGLRARGMEVREEPQGLADRRKAARLFSLGDPSGYRHEFFATRMERSADGGKLSSDLRGPGFRTGDLGMGHILPVCSDYDAGIAFYRDVLGLRYSDRIRQEMAPGFFADATFFHTATGRHHSLATGAFPSEKRLNHIMLEYRDMDDVGFAHRRAKEAGIPILLDFGHHPNDQMFSFYMQTPSGFGLELGYGGIVIDDQTWEPQVYDQLSDWGHARLA